MKSLSRLILKLVLLIIGAAACTATLAFLLPVLNVVLHVIIPLLLLAVVLWLVRIAWRMLTPRQNCR